MTCYRVMKLELLTVLDYHSLKVLFCPTWVSFGSVLWRWSSCSLSKCGVPVLPLTSVPNGRWLLKLLILEVPLSYLWGSLICDAFLPTSCSAFNALSLLFLYLAFFWSTLVFMVSIHKLERWDNFSFVLFFSLFRFCANFHLKIHFLIFTITRLIIELMQCLIWEIWN